MKTNPRHTAQAQVSLTPESQTLVDGYRLRVIAFAGIRFNLGADCGTLEQVRASMASRLRRLRADGFTVRVLRSGQEYEAVEPEDAQMVPDSAGYYLIAPVLAPSVECHECGLIVRRGDSCDCQTEDEPSIANGKVCGSCWTEYWDCVEGCGERICVCNLSTHECDD